MGVALTRSGLPSRNAPFYMDHIMNKGAAAMTALALPDARSDIDALLRDVLVQDRDYLTKNFVTNVIDCMEDPDLSIAGLDAIMRRYVIGEHGAVTAADSAVEASWRPRSLRGRIMVENVFRFDVATDKSPYVLDMIYRPLMKDAPITIPAGCSLEIESREREGGSGSLVFTYATAEIAETDRDETAIAAETAAICADHRNRIDYATRLLSEHEGLVRERDDVLVALIERHKNMTRRAQTAVEAVKASARN
jgi:hypothetical protein